MDWTKIVIRTVMSVPIFYLLLFIESKLFLTTTFSQYWNIGSSIGFFLGNVIYFWIFDREAGFQPRSSSRFIWNDAVIVLAMALNFGAMLATRIITSTIGAFCATANVLETNPVQRALLSIQPLQVIVLFAFYGVMLAIYLAIRKDALKSPKTSRLLINSFTLAIFLALFYDFLNDFGILLGLLLH